MIHELQIQKTPAVVKLIEAVNAELDSGKEVRRWSYEIEANYLGASYAELERLRVYDFKTDTSVNYKYEECECDTCNHDCNCDSCDRNNGYDYSDPCEESSYTEIAPNKYSRVITPDHENNIAKACEILRDNGASVDNSTGGHIHIDAKELHAVAVSNIMKVWHGIQEAFPEIVGRTYREAEGFADQVNDYDIQAVMRNEQTGRGAVNPNNWLNHQQNTSYKNTIEFRQFSGTLDHNLIIIRGLLCRKIVEYCERNFSVYYLLNARTPEAILRELGI